MLKLMAYLYIVLLCIETEAIYFSEAIFFLKHKNHYFLKSVYSLSISQFDKCKMLTMGGTG